ncbi:hypothetical protein CORC01_00586 [Colletotrichum orchidophilum]|uniref:Uncharacterized protein n=1 Tax=Colletotrichum orchidophilum TaxID=1209926 RepID=A0A1G4BSK6_9PEZI|nr:uncharacterized protein CORC01_00586 [Colletotrichum orchidophilum]OHF04247.1 hypothetical protein CORC01_00586 [Colletotrichum orchidophilum]
MSWSRWSSASRSPDHDVALRPCMHCGQITGQFPFCLLAVGPFNQASGSLLSFENPFGIR